MQHQLLGKELLSFKALASRIRAVGVSRGASLATLHRWRSRNQLAAVRVGGTWYSTWADFEAFVQHRSMRGDAHHDSTPAQQIEDPVPNGDW